MTDALKIGLDGGVDDMDNVLDIDILLERYGDAIYRVCCLYLKDRHLAEDAAQETFIKAYKSYSSFEKRSDEKTWLTRIAINTCKNYLRSSWMRRIDLNLPWKTQLEVVNGGNSASFEEPDNQIVKKEQEKEIIEAVSKLPEKYRDVILLYYYQGLKTAEIAQVLNIGSGAVRTRLYRGKNQLEKIMKGVIFSD